MDCEKGGGSVVKQVELQAYDKADQVLEAAEVIKKRIDKLQ